MELRSLQSPAVSGISRGGFTEKPFLYGLTTIKLPCGNKNCPSRRRLNYVDFRAPVTGSSNVKLEISCATSSGVGQKDENFVFVAGATGKVGSRTVRELLKLGFNVRAGVRSTQRAESLVESVKNTKLEGVEGGNQATDKLEVVVCDLEKRDQIGPALGNSSIVICCIGASEKEISDITGPYRIDFKATQNLVDAASSAKVDHFILVTSLGTNKFGFPAAILNLFWGVLIWKRKAEEALIASGLTYSIVRPGGMERPTDSFKETHNITLSEQDTLFGGLVSNLQVAELLAFMAKNRSLSFCKIVEVVAETSAPLTPTGDLLQRISSQRVEVSPSKGSVLPKPVLPEPVVPALEPEEVKPTDTTPLSPYTAYDDLKPPTSPSPSVPTLSNNNKPGKPEVIEQHSTPKGQPLSPFTMYEDLKPPASPSPTPPKL